ncbi:hypothetical protein TNCV_757301 [Trichonephila clavipes]|nr:hypothetical protein TNCV_757301 [Trichonephila clavipes]
MKCFLTGGKVSLRLAIASVRVRLLKVEGNFEPPCKVIHLLIAEDLQKPISIAKCKFFGMQLLYHASENSPGDLLGSRHCGWRIPVPKGSSRLMASRDCGWDAERLLLVANISSGFVSVRPF